MIPRRPPIVFQMLVFSIVLAACDGGSRSRTPDEFAAGHLKGAKNIDFMEDDFAKKLAEVEGRPIIVHCGSGGRSTKALKALETRNFPQIYHLKSGYKGWVQAGKPVVGAPPPAK